MGRRGERRPVVGVVYEQGNRACEEFRIQPAEDARASFAAARLRHFERGVVGVRDERQRALRVPACGTRRHLTVGVFAHRESAPFELASDGAELTELVIRSGRSGCDAFDRRERCVDVGHGGARHASRGYRQRSVLRLYDTRRRAVVPFRPLGSPITVYVCGVTPYDTTHLGNARTFLAFDVLVRHLEAAGKAVRYAQNVTDIDESILARATRDGVSWRDLGRSEERAFLADMRRLGWRKPDVMPHATREIPSMRRMIDVLLDKDCAYEIRGGVYFDTARAQHNGELSRFPVARMRRILAAQDDAALDDPQRRHPIDFALWRRVPSGAMLPMDHRKRRPRWPIEGLAS